MDQEGIVVYPCSCTGWFTLVLVRRKTTFVSLFFTWKRDQYWLAFVGWYVRMTDRLHFSIFLSLAANSLLILISVFPPGMSFVVVEPGKKRSERKRPHCRTSIPPTKLELQTNITYIKQWQRAELDCGLKLGNFPFIWPCRSLQARTTMTQRDKRPQSTTGNTFNIRRIPILTCANKSKN